MWITIDNEFIPIRYISYSPLSYSVYIESKYLLSLNYEDVKRFVCRELLYWSGSFFSVHSGTHKFIIVPGKYDIIPKDIDSEMYVFYGHITFKYCRIYYIYG